MKNIIVFISVILVLNCLVHSASAQKKATIEGVVTDSKGIPLAGASVSLFKIQDSSLIGNTISDEKGNYEFESLTGTSYFLTFNVMGYEKGQSVFFPLVTSQVYYCDTARLLFVQKKLEAIVITSQKNNFIETKMDKIVLNIDNSPAAAGSSVFDLLEKSPGIFSDKNGNLSMQGKSGVQVLIDGRPTYMSGSDLTILLKSMQSNEVQTIELITNPSAKYEASGNAGIINIKTKKNKKYGTNGTLTSVVGYGKDPKANAGVSFNNRRENVNIFGNYNYGYDKNSRTLAIDREVLKDAVTTHFGQVGTQFNTNNTHWFKLGIDYSFNKNNLLGFLINRNENIDNQHSINETLMGRQKLSVDSSLFADNLFKQHYRNHSYNLNFKSVLNEEGAELTFDADYSRYKSDVNSSFQNYYYKISGERLKDPYFSKNNTCSDITIKSIKSDYAQTFSSGLKLETGVKATLINSDNNLNYSALNGSEWENDITKSNHFIYEEKVYAAYVNTSKKRNNTSLQAGLRAEYSETKGNSLTDNKTVKRKYFDFFPSIFFNQKLSDAHSIGLSYSKRIQRPDYESLNPFVFNIDEYTYQKGNPFLHPEYNQSIEFRYLFKNKYMLQLGYMAIHDVITEVILADTAKKALYQTNKNIDHQNNLRVTLSVPFQITKWWKVTNNLNGVQMNLKSPDLEGQQLNVSQFFVIGNSNHYFKIYKDFAAELNARYTSPLLYGTLKIQSEFLMDAGVSKKVLKKKGSLKFSVSDFLNTKDQRVSSVYSGVNYTLKQKQETRVFRLSFTYHFGNNNVKQSRNRTTGLEEEQGRLKSGGN